MTQRINAISSLMNLDSSRLIWHLDGHNVFDYSDGDKEEDYIKSVFEKDIDLSSQSDELESYIKDWPSEYHFSTKRSRLFDLLSFDRSSRVVWVGCGCGAITRYLGETFDSVLAVEGSARRAEIARKRTLDLNGVEIVCAPFQKLEFKQTFDVIFCIGVLEYSPSFVNSNDPFGEMISNFSSLLSENGTLVLAIENQLGLKYFSGFNEDHAGRPFEGIMGYPHTHNRFGTFGKPVLSRMLKQSFSDIEFYFPFPDYKLPDLLECNTRSDTNKSGNL